MPMIMFMRAAHASRPLASMKQLCLPRHNVFFDDEGSFIVNKSIGEVSWVRKDDGISMVDAWMPPEYNEELCIPGFSQVSVADSN